MDRDLRVQYPVGAEPAWHEFTSTTLSQAVADNFVQRALVSNEPFTIFHITLTTRRACKISDLSESVGEDQVLLPPGSRFLVTAGVETGNEACVEMQELPPFEAILEYGDFIPGVYLAISVSRCHGFSLYLIPSLCSHSHNFVSVTPFL